MACEKIFRPHALSCGHGRRNISELLLQLLPEIHSYDSKGLAGQRYAKPFSHKGCDCHPNFRPCNWCCASQRKRNGCGADVGHVILKVQKVMKDFEHTHTHIYIYILSFVICNHMCSTFRHAHFCRQISWGSTASPARFTSPEVLFVHFG